MFLVCLKIAPTKVLVTTTNISHRFENNKTSKVGITYSPARERAADARRPPGGNRQSHPLGIALTPRYSPRPRLDNIRPAAAPPEEPPDLTPFVDVPFTPYDHDTEPVPTAQAVGATVSEADAGPT
ncbi:unnamed protein product [Euphydryas editha]|uniref:Uncharacterized protein n=1 Tax=Euphydryas editha TaxID=104508 RepID=A0AAU9V2Y3_EUPED|nr:unnamed protein product [Euphydryas editha]